MPSLARVAGQEGQGKRGGQQAGLRGALLKHPEDKLRGVVCGMGGRVQGSPSASLTGTPPPPQPSLPFLDLDWNPSPKPSPHAPKFRLQATRRAGPGGPLTWKNRAGPLTPEEGSGPRSILPKGGCAQRLSCVSGSTARLARCLFAGCRSGPWLTCAGFAAPRCLPSRKRRGGSQVADVP